jgi:hypothetical protein
LYCEFELEVVECLIGSYFWKLEAKFFIGIDCFC